MSKGRLPALRPDKNECASPHVVLLGAGASRAACPNGDANGRRLPLMVDLVPSVGLDRTLARAGINSSRAANFEPLYESLVGDPKMQGLVREIEDRLYDYFSALVIPSRATLYDRLILSLRPKDYIATFNWDPLLIQAYRRNRHLRELPQLLFLHGNVGAGVCVRDQRKGFVDHSCSECGRPLIQRGFYIRSDRRTTPRIRSLPKNGPRFETCSRKRTYSRSSAMPLPYPTLRRLARCDRRGVQTQPRSLLRSISSILRARMSSRKPGRPSSCVTTMGFGSRRFHSSITHDVPATILQWLACSYAHVGTPHCPKLIVSMNSKNGSSHDGIGNCPSGSRGAATMLSGTQHRGIARSCLTRSGTCHDRGRVRFIDTVRSSSSPRFGVLPADSNVSDPDLLPRILRLSLAGSR